MPNSCDSRTGDGGGGRRDRAPIKAGDELDPVEAMRRGVAPVGKKRFLSEGDYDLIEDDDPALVEVGDPRG